MNRGMINLLLFVCWIAALAALIFRMVPGWLAFAAMGLLIVVGTIANRRKASPDRQPSSAPSSRVGTQQRGKTFGRKEQSYDELIQSIRQKSDATRTDAERRLLEGHIFAAYFYHQGGFDYYFAHVDETERWALAATALTAAGHDDATPIFHEAVKLFTSHDNMSADQDATKAYLSQMRVLDARFRSAVPDLEASLREYAKKI
jgi:hypothetical protein